MPLPPYPLAGEHWALFLDFDGTLTNLVTTPDDVEVEPRVPETLVECLAAFGGAVALVSGRTIEELDHLLAPARLPAAGLHGLVRRDAEGRTEHHEPASEALTVLRRALEAACEADARLLVEDKGAAIALHYRRAPEREAECLRLVERAVADVKGFEVLRGKCVIEAKPAGSNKGHAIARFMREPPFAGRIPVFAGDDATDEDGFAAVARLGGFGIKVGEGDTRAPYRAASVRSLLDWLHGLPPGVEGLARQ